MISNTIAQKLNSQINKEFYSAYFYMSMSAHSQSENLRGVAAWFMAKESPLYSSHSRGRSHSHRDCMP